MASEGAYHETLFRYEDPGCSFSRDSMHVGAVGRPGIYRLNVLLDGFEAMEIDGVEVAAGACDLTGRQITVALRPISQFLPSRSCRRSTLVCSGRTCLAIPAAGGASMACTEDPCSNDCGAYSLHCRRGDGSCGCIDAPGVRPCE
jgi:hypothetical protein